MCWPFLCVFLLLLKIVMNCAFWQNKLAENFRDYPVYICHTVSKQSINFYKWNVIITCIFFAQWKYISCLLNYHIVSWLVYNDLIYVFIIDQFIVGLYYICDLFYRLFRCRVLSVYSAAEVEISSRYSVYNVIVRHLFMALLPVCIW